MLKEALESLAAMMRKPTIESVKRIALGGDTTALALVPNGYEVRSLKPYMDEQRFRPDRRKGNSLHRSLPSFIEWFNRHKDEASVIFADVDPTGVTLKDQNLRGIIDYHEAGEEPITPDVERRARHGEFMATYPFPWSLEMQAWHETNAAPLSQIDLAMFLERHIDDVTIPPTSIVDGRKQTVTGDPEIDKLLARMDKTVGTPADLIALAKGISINAEAKAGVQYNHSTGESALMFEEAHKTDKIVVPNVFLIAIPVFVGLQDAVLIAVHLRYRLKAGMLTWFLELHRLDRVIADSVQRVIARVEDETKTGVFIGRAQA